MKSIKSVFIKAACMLSLVLVSNSFSSTQAQPVQYAVSATETKGDIRFVNAQDGMLVFELNLKNLPAKGSMLQIKDEAGNVIFERSIKTETFNVRYKIERNNISKISFEVTAKKMLLNKTFSINSRMEERIEVAKL
jgi:uncharacterized protein YxjI